MWTGIAWCVSAPSFGRRLHHKRKCSLRFFDREWLSTRTANHRRYDGNGEWRFESDQMPNSRNRMPFEFSNFVIANHTTRTKLIFSHIYFFVPFLRRWKTIFLLTLNKHYYLPSMCVCVCLNGANTCVDTETRSSAIQRFRSTKSNAIRWDIDVCCRVRHHIGAFLREHALR